MPSIEAVYENGVFRPLQPVALPEGARVEVFAVGPESQATQSPASATGGEPLSGEALATLIERLDQLPLEGVPTPDLSTTYREILYPKQGRIP